MKEHFSFWRRVEKSNGRYDFELKSDLRGLRGRASPLLQWWRSRLWSYPATVYPSSQRAIRPADPRPRARAAERPDVWK